MVSANVLRRHTSRGVAGSWPAPIIMRHKASTGAELCAANPAAAQQSEPIRTARIETACGDREDGLAVELVRSAIETLPRAHDRACGFGGAAFSARIDHSGSCRSVFLRPPVRSESHSLVDAAGKIILRVDRRVTGGASPSSSSRSIVRSEQRHSRANSRFVRNSSFGVVSDIRALRLRYRLRGMAGKVALRESS